MPLIPSFRASWIAAFFFRGIGTGLFLYATMNYLALILPKEVVSKGVALLTIFYNVMLGIGDLFVPDLANIIGYKAIFIIIGISNFVSIIFLLIKKTNYKSEKMQLKS